MGDIDPKRNKSIRRNSSSFGYFILKYNNHLGSEIEIEEMDPFRRLKKNDEKSKFQLR